MKTTSLFLLIATSLFSLNALANACRSHVKERKSFLKSIKNTSEQIEENLKRFDDVLNINRFDAAKTYIHRAQASVNNMILQIEKRLERSSVVYPSCKDSDRRRLDNYVDDLNEHLSEVETLNIHVTEFSTRF